MKEKIGFDRQSKYYGECGIFSLLHSLLVLGIPVSLGEIHRATGLPRSITAARGTNEHAVKDAVRYFNCTPEEFTLRSSSAAKVHIERLLKRGIPIIVSVQNYAHWAVLTGLTQSGSFYWIDSSIHEVIGISPWAEIDEWLETEGEYYFIGVLPKGKNSLRHSLVLDFKSARRFMQDPILREWWGYYLQDLKAIFDSPVNSHAVLPADKFFLEYSAILEKSIASFLPADSKFDIKYEISNLRKIAVAHHLTISKKRIPEGIAQAASCLTLLSSGYY